MVLNFQTLDLGRPNNSFSSCQLPAMDLGFVFQIWESCRKSWGGLPPSHQSIEVFLQFFRNPIPKTSKGAPLNYRVSQWFWNDRSETVGNVGWCTMALPRSQQTAWDAVHRIPSPFSAAHEPQSRSIGDSECPLTRGTQRLKFAATPKSVWF